MKAEQVLDAAEKAVSALLGLQWRRISNTNSGPRGFRNWQKQCFEFLKPDGTVACTTEFKHMEYDEGPMCGSLWGRSGKVLDVNGAVVIEVHDNLVNVNGSPEKHPLNDLHRMIWGKESGEPVSQEGKFPETIALEKFTEELGA